MFDTSGNYDNLNRVISFGIDIKWRKKYCIWLRNQIKDNSLLQQEHEAILIGADKSRKNYWFRYLLVC
jgi:hypothetical protein